MQIARKIGKITIGTLPRGYDSADRKKALLLVQFDPQLALVLGDAPLHSPCALSFYHPSDAVGSGGTSLSTETTSRLRGLMHRIRPHIFNIKILLFISKEIRRKEIYDGPMNTSFCGRPNDSAALRIARLRREKLWWRFKRMQSSALWSILPRHDIT